VIINIVIKSDKGFALVETKRIVQKPIPMALKRNMLNALHVQVMYGRGSDLTSITATFKEQQTNQIHLTYPINQSDTFDISD
jgi:hypothetical protein